MPGSPYPVGSHPEGVRAGDLDRDGKLDLAVANYGSSTVSVLLGNGDGTFHAAGPATPVSGTNPYMVAIADLNGDGKPDLATSNYSSNDVSVLFGSGDGAFTEATGSPFAVGSGPYWVDIGDLDGDGRPDLVTSNFNSNDLTVLLNTYVFPPGAPPDVTAVAGHAQATITWSPPADDGGAAPVRRRKPKLALSQTASRTTLRAGQHATLAIRVRNPSSRAVGGVRVCDRLPSGLLYVSSDPAARLTKDGYCWTLRSLGARSTRTLLLRVRALPGARGRKVNRATSTASGARTTVVSAAIRLLPARAVGGGVTG